MRESSDRHEEPAAAVGTASSPRTWAARAAAVIPGGASTGSKRPYALYGRDDPHAPTHFARAHGCRVTTADGRELTDFTSALGSVALGYADDEVARAVCHAASTGTVSGLPSTLEVEVAERLCDVIPCAERVRFYGAIISHDPEYVKAKLAGYDLQAENALGWANRIAEFIESPTP